MRPRRLSNDSGYALVVAVTSVLAFAYIAFQVLATDEGGIGAMAGRISQAKLSAAADAGIVLAVHALANPDSNARWPLRGPPQEVDYAGDHLTITLEDERGKAPLAGLNDAQTKALFASAGVTGDRLDALVAELRDWETQKDTVENAPREPEAWPVRHGPVRTLGELAGLKDMDPALLARITPALTVFFEESGPFAPQNASPLALATMESSPEQGLGFGQFTLSASIATDHSALTTATDDNLQGHTITVRVTAQDHSGARTHRMAIVELTGDTQHPYWIRYVE